MTTVRGLAPLSSADAQTLVLGSMPGKESLRVGRYYAHPRNAFWPLIGEVLGLEPALDYDDRVARMIAAKIALWDVLHLCRRTTSLDADIEDPVANDFVAFFARHPRIIRVCFNGTAAADLYRKQTLPTLDPARPLEYVRLPSTSPANASIPRATKLEAWSVLRPA